MYQLKNEKGMIALHKNIIANIMTEAIAEFDEKVFLCTQKGKLPLHEPKNFLMMDIIFTNQQLEVKVYLLVRFGTSINLITNKILDKAYEDIESLLGICPSKITLVVSGIISKQTIVKRNIEVSR